MKKKTKVTIIKESQIKVLSERLFSANPFDFPLICELAERFNLTLPDPQIAFQLEVWKNMFPEEDL